MRNKVKESTETQGQLFSATSVTAMQITSELLKKQSGHFDLGCITRLNLSHLGIEKIQGLEQCPLMTELALDHNKIRSPSSLDALVNLKVLNLSSNAIKSIETFKLLPNLKELYLQNNAIVSVDFQALAQKCPKLQVLSFQNADGSDSNPSTCLFVFFFKDRIISMIVCQHSSLYRNNIGRELPSLMILDGQSLQFQQVTSIAAPVSGQENDFESITKSSWEFNGIEHTVDASELSKELMQPFRDAIERVRQDMEFN